MLVGGGVGKNLGVGLKIFRSGRVCCGGSTPLHVMATGTFSAFSAIRYNLKHFFLISFRGSILVATARLKFRLLV